MHSTRLNPFRSPLCPKPSRARTLGAPTCSRNPSIYAAICSRIRTNQSGSVPTAIRSSNASTAFKGTRSASILTSLIWLPSRSTQTQVTRTRIPSRTLMPKIRSTMSYMPLCLMPKPTPTLPHLQPYQSLCSNSTLTMQIQIHRLPPTPTPHVVQLPSLPVHLTRVLRPLPAPPTIVRTSTIPMLATIMARNPPRPRLPTLPPATHRASPTLLGSHRAINPKSLIPLPIPRPLRPQRLRLARCPSIPTCMELRSRTTTMPPLLLQQPQQQ